ncbi:MAG: ArnT family glycosyltransferase [Candidatus Hodarchaeales archaeon]
MVPNNNFEQKSEENTKTMITIIGKHLKKHKDIYIPLLLAITIGAIGIILKLYNLHSIGTWDEGWYVNIMRRMNETGNWFLPLYYVDGETLYINSEQIIHGFHGYVIFDKPPMIFWFGSFFASIFGYTSLAAKLPMALSSGLLGVVGFFIYDVSKKEGTERVSGIFTGLMGASAYFISLYGRTSYLDTVVIFFSALTVVLAMRTFDNTLEGRYKKGIIYGVLLGIINTVAVFAKAWQGLIVGPSIALYIILRFCSSFFNTDNLEKLVTDFKNLKVEFSEELHSEMFAIIAGALSYSIIATFDMHYKEIPIPVPGFPLQLSFLGAFGCIITILFVKLFCDFIEPDENRSKVYHTLLTYLFIACGSLIGVIAGTVINNTIIETFTWSFNEIFTGLDYAEFAEPVLYITGAAVFLFIELAAIITLSMIAGTFISKDSRFIQLFKDVLLLVPIGVVGIWTAFWFLFILIKGNLFNRELIMTFSTGIAVPLIMLAAIIIIYAIIERKKVDNLLFYDIDLRKYLKFLMIFLFVLVLITLSFYPLVSWIQFIDNNLESIGYYIRVPGELWRYSDEIPENGMTLEYIFYEYYIGWRYTHETKYALFDSLRGIINDPIFVMGIPFFVMGLYYFIKTRDFSKGLMLSSWFVVVIATLIPSHFQLDYYYLAVFLPYYAIVAKGMAESFRKGSGSYLRQFWEKLLVMLPFYFFLLFSLVTDFWQVLTNSVSLQSYLDNVMSYLTNDSILFNLVLFSCLVIVFARTIPGIITLMIAVPYFSSTFLIGKIQHKYTVVFLFVAGMALIFIYQKKDTFYNFIRNNRYHTRVKQLSKEKISRLTKFEMNEENFGKVLKLTAAVLLLMTLITLIFSFRPGDIPMELVMGCFILIAGVLFAIYKKVPIGSLIIVCLILMTSVAAVSKLTFYNNYYDISFDETADFILNHGGDFNYSTWIFDENGAKYAMRYCLGYDVIVGVGANNPFSRYNNPYDPFAETYFNNFMRDTTARFWLILTEEYWSRKPTTSYNQTFSWFDGWGGHIHDVTHLTKISENSKTRLYANTTWLEELGYL